MPVMDGFEANGPHSHCCLDETSRCARLACWERTSCSIEAGMVYGDIGSAYVDIGEDFGAIMLRKVAGSGERAFKINFRGDPNATEAVTYELW